MEPWCYQVKKDGYKDSDVICREGEGYRNLDFNLVPLKTTITSKPSGATIYWGPSTDQLHETKRVTPQAITIKDVSKGASWQDWCYQVKKDGYHPSEIVCLTRQSVDRHVNFELKSVARGKAALSGTLSLALKDSPSDEYRVADSQVTLAWDDNSSNEFGFKIERKTESNQDYIEIDMVGENVTTYTDTDLSQGTVYWYRVRSYNSQGESAPSNEILVRIVR
jgi:hypothetical protein